MKRALEAKAQAVNAIFIQTDIIRHADSGRMVLQRPSHGLVLHHINAYARSAAGGQAATQQAEVTGKVSGKVGSILQGALRPDVGSNPVGPFDEPGMRRVCQQRRGKELGEMIGLGCQPLGRKPASAGTSR
jgi:hypothetical protein